MRGVNDLWRRFVRRGVRVPLQVSGVLGQVRGYFGELEVGAVHHSSFTAAALGTNQILETLAAQTAAVVLRT